MPPATVPQSHHASGIGGSPHGRLLADVAAPVPSTGPLGSPRRPWRPSAGGRGSVGGGAAWGVGGSPRHGGLHADVAAPARCPPGPLGLLRGGPGGRRQAAEDLWAAAQACWGGRWITTAPAGLPRGTWRRPLRAPPARSVPRGGPGGRRQAAEDLWAAAQRGASVDRHGTAGSTRTWRRLRAPPARSVLRGGPGRPHRQAAEDLWAAAQRGAAAQDRHGTAELHADVVAPAGATGLLGSPEGVPGGRRQAAEDMWPAAPRGASVDPHGTAGSTRTWGRPRAPPASSVSPEGGPWRPPTGLLGSPRRPWRPPAGGRGSVKRRRSGGTGGRGSPRARQVQADVVAPAPSTGPLGSPRSPRRPPAGGRGDPAGAVRRPAPPDTVPRPPGGPARSRPRLPVHGSRRAVPP